MAVLCHRLHPFVLSKSSTEVHEQRPGGLVLPQASRAQQRLHQPVEPLLLSPNPQNLLWVWKKGPTTDGTSPEGPITL